VQVDVQCIGTYHLTVLSRRLTGHRVIDIRHRHMTIDGTSSQERTLVPSTRSVRAAFRMRIVR
jgi:hypothetical protein